MPPLADEVLVDVAERRQEPVRIVHRRDLVAVARAHPVVGRVAHAVVAHGEGDDGGPHAVLLVHRTVLSLGRDDDDLVSERAQDAHDGARVVGVGREVRAEHGVGVERPPGRGRGERVRLHDDGWRGG